MYYHLGEFDESLTFALGAGHLFDASSKSEYVETIICTFQKIPVYKLDNEYLCSQGIRNFIFIHLMLFGSNSN